MQARGKRVRALEEVPDFRGWNFMGPPVFGGSATV